MKHRNNPINAKQAVARQRSNDKTSGIARVEVRLESERTTRLDDLVAQGYAPTRGDVIRRLIDEYDECATRVMPAP
jgi:hypothetical protein